MCCSQSARETPCTARQEPRGTHGGCAAPWGGGAPHTGAQGQRPRGGRTPKRVTGLAVVRDTRGHRECKQAAKQQADKNNANNDSDSNNNNNDNDDDKSNNVNS